MSLFLSQDRQHYRGWVTIIASAILPGAGQFLSGRRRTGVLWFVLAALMSFTAFLVIFSPLVASANEQSAVQILDGCLGLIILADAVRQPMRRIGFQGWAKLVALSLAILLVSVFSLRSLLHPFKMGGGSMEPTIRGKQRSGATAPDRFIVDKVSYWFRAPRRGDIVMFDSSGVKGGMLPTGTRHVSRLVGLPGEKVSISPPAVFINGKRLSEPTIFEKISNSSSGFSGYVTGPGLLERSSTTEWTVGPNEYFVLGDNSKFSFDSRSYGPIAAGSIKGRVCKIYGPSERVGIPE